VGERRWGGRGLGVRDPWGGHLICRGVIVGGGGGCCCRSWC
jgi:hypothetical protein